MALQGEVALQEPTPSQVLHWRLAGIRLEQMLGAAFQPVTIAEATGRLSNQGDGLVLEAALQIPVFALAPGTLGQRQPRLTHVAFDLHTDAATVLDTPGHGHGVGYTPQKRSCRGAAAPWISAPGPTHSDLIHRLLFGEVLTLPDEIPILGAVLRHLNPFQLIHQHIELSATVQGNIFRRNSAGQPDVHVNVYFIQ